MVYNQTGRTIYKLYIDGSPALGNSGTYIYFKDNNGSSGIEDQLPGNLIGFFDNLTAGTHTVQLYAYTTTGTSQTVYYDPGCYGMYRNLLIKEFR